MSDNVKKHEKKMFEHCGSVPIHVKTLKNRFSSYFGCVLVIALGLSVTPHSYLVEGGGGSCSSKGVFSGSDQVLLGQQLEAVLVGSSGATAGSA